MMKQNKAAKGGRTLKINEVEQKVGITKKNIRFYEAQGLLCPNRNSDNGYRDYNDDDIATLCRIKLLRKLGFPLEEIRQMQTRSYTIADGMARHMIVLEREQKNLTEAQSLCKELTTCQGNLESLDGAALLARMETLEHAGTTFMDKQKLDKQKSKRAPIAIAIAFCIVCIACIVVCIWGVSTVPDDPMFMIAMGVVCLMLLCAMFGTLAVTSQRLREITKGELDDARQY